MRKHFKTIYTVACLAIWFFFAVRAYLDNSLGKYFFETFQFLALYFGTVLAIMYIFVAKGIWTLCRESRKNPALSYLLLLEVFCDPKLSKMRKKVIMWAIRTSTPKYVGKRRMQEDLGNAAKHGAFGMNAILP